MDKLEKRVIAKLPENLLNSFEKIINNIKEDQYIKLFFLKSFSHYPVYTQIQKERGISAKNTGMHYYGYGESDIELISFIQAQTDPVGLMLLDEARECFRMFTSRLYYSPYLKLMYTKEFKDMENYILREQKPIRFNVFRIVKPVEVPNE